MLYPVGLLQRESYPTELIQRLESKYQPTGCLILSLYYSALNFSNQKAIIGSWQRVSGHGRPRRMYQVSQSGKPRLKIWHVCGRSLQEVPDVAS